MMKMKKTNEIHESTYRMKMKQRTVRVLMAMVGWAVLLCGVLMIPLPGPGWLVVFIGLSILARQFVWAEKLNIYAKGKYDLWELWMKNQPLYVKALFGVLATSTMVVVLWLINTFGFVNDWLHLGYDWLSSPLF